MEQLKDLGQLERYLQAHGLESVFSEQLRSHLALYRFDENELICSQGEPAGQLYVLVKGKIKVYQTSTEGRTLIISFRTPLDTIGDIEYVQEIDMINTVQAVSSVWMIGVSYHALKKLAHDHLPFIRFLLENVTKKFYQKSHSMSLNMMYSVEVRLASYFLSVTNSQLERQLIISNLTDIAGFIGTSYRHLNRVLNQFCEEGLIERGSGCILIRDRKGLGALAGGNIYE